MRAAMIEDERKIALTEIPEPEPDGKNVIMKVSMAGISGYDTTLWELGKITKEVVPGHELLGIVTDPGSRDDLKVGDRVTVIPLASCLDCEFCKSGNENLCFKNRFTAGKGKGGYGTFAEYFSARPEFVRKVPDNLTDFEALMLSPAATAYHIVKEMNVQKGWKVLITGGGVMGALIAMWCKYFGAKFIGVVEKNKYRALNMMDYNEASRVFDAEDTDLVDTLIEASGGFNVHFECSGAAKYINTGILTLRRGSTIATLSLYQKSAPVNFYMLGSKLIRLRSFNAHTLNDFDAVLDLVLNNKKLNLKRYYSASVALSDLQETFVSLTAEDHKYEKVVVDKF